MNTELLYEEVLPGDQHIMCIDCGARFVLSMSERAWLSDMGFQVPKRCRSCRWLKRQRYLAIGRAVLP